MIFFAVFLCHIEPTCQKLRFYNQNCEFWPLGPLLPFLKGPPNSSKTEIFKKKFFCFSFFFFFFCFFFVAFNFCCMSFTHFPQWDINRRHSFVQLRRGGSSSITKVMQIVLKVMSLADDESLLQKVQEAVDFHVIIEWWLALHEECDFLCVLMGVRDEPLFVYFLRWY